MHTQLQQFKHNLEKIEQFTGSQRKRWILDFAMQLTIRQRNFNGADYEKVKQIIKQHSKWFSTLRGSEKIHRSYFLQYNSDTPSIEQAINRQRLLGKKSIFKAEERYLAVVKMEDIKRLLEMEEALKTQPSLRYLSLPLVQVAILAKNPADIATIANSYERYYNELKQLNWVVGVEMRASACMLASQTGHYNQEVIDRIIVLTKSFQKYMKTMEAKQYLVICLLALTPFSDIDFTSLLQLQQSLKPLLPMKNSDDLALLYAAQLYTLVEAPNVELVNSLEYVDIINDITDSHDSDSSGGSSDGGSSGGGD